jgi:hypothetical protein
MPAKNWSMYEINMLIEEMRFLEEKLRFKDTGIKYRTMSADDRGHEIQERLRQLDPSVIRTVQQIWSKWEKMVGDFKKVYDYEKNIPIGQDAYWDMLQPMKKERRLPANFAKSLFSR